MFMTRRDWARAVMATAMATAVATQFASAQDNALPSGKAMTSAAQRFLDALTDGQRGKAQYALDAAERFNWHFIPLHDVATKTSTRKGVPIEDMSREAQAAALDMMKAGMSEDAYKWAEAIRAREDLLAQLEPNNAWYRRKGWYFFTVYGKPGPTGQWGWRVDGHHMSVSFALKDGELVSATPFFMGLNPVTIMTGDKKGERNVFPQCQDLACKLVEALDADQKKVAVLSKNLTDVQGKTVKAPDDLPKGLSAGKMTAAQQKMLLELVAHYTARMPAALAKTETDRLTTAGVDNISFVFTGEPEVGKIHTYAIQGPTFQIHYMCDQMDSLKTPANHIHSCYRSLKDDFGGVKPKP